jgi:hypothetical protein
MPLLDLFRRRWKHKDPDVRGKAVEKLTNQVLLAEIARADDDGGVREKAVQRLTDQGLLADIFRAGIARTSREWDASRRRSKGSPTKPSSPT